MNIIDDGDDCKNYYNKMFNGNRIHCEIVTIKLFYQYIE